MNILIDGDVFTWQKHGGVSRIYKEVLPRLAKLDANLVINIMVPSNMDCICDGLGINTKQYPQLDLSNLKPWRFWRHVSPVLNNWLFSMFCFARKADVVHSTYYSVLPHKAPSVCFVHDLIVELYPQYLEREYVVAECERKRLAIMNSKVIICNSESTRRDLERTYDIAGKHCYVARLAGFDKQCTDVKEELKLQGVKYLLYVGDCISPYKNFELILRGLSDAVQSHLHDVKLVVATSRAPSKNIMNKFYEYMDEDKLFVMPGRSDSALRWLYQNCLAFVYPSFCEGFGIPLIEAAECGAPVLCSDIGVFREVAGNAAYYFDPSSESDFCAALDKALSDGRQDKLMSARRMRLARKYSWDKTARVFLDAFYAVCG